MNAFVSKSNAFYNVTHNISSGHSKLRTNRTVWGSPIRSSHASRFSPLLGKPSMRKRVLLLFLYASPMASSSNRTVMDDGTIAPSSILERINLASSEVPLSRAPRRRSPAERCVQLLSRPSTRSWHWVPFPVPGAPRTKTTSEGGSGDDVGGEGDDMFFLVLWYEVLFRVVYGSWCWYGCECWCDNYSRGAVALRECCAILF
mmetsp:Transcript_19128/g.39282  ORF Transcript_19128/g.39282 Transcript_19128/m.39282 type:complete len:202 (-) Transcript_19128:68-673(-)